ncbi:MAG TPA: SGNH/GDSL hydrolase family protein [Tepidisphaeraceae bacterium]|nr:SGNH/GDSL hydrolase family protein [Tepidisphaeraceae bacterium]
MRIPRLAALLLVLLGLNVCAADAPKVWHGYPRHDFVFEGRPACVIAPVREAATFADGGKAWIWKARFLDHRPDLDLALLELGFHVAFLEDTAETLGSPDCVAQYARFHEKVTTEYGLAKRAALEGLSRGGLYVYNFAAAHPDKTACVYADGAVLDFRSWPAGKGVFPDAAGPGSKGSWESLKKAYGFADDAAARAWRGNPVDNLKPVAAAKIPVLHVIGGADPVVPPAENTLLLKKRLEELGGAMELIVKPGEKHAHGVGDVSGLVDWVVKHTCGAGRTRPVLFAKDGGPARRILVLGDSITHGGRYLEYVAQVLATRYPDRAIEMINIGLASETVSGLSEEGHADGKFPRPDLHERLDRALEKARPEVVIACYGMNDGIYKPLADDRFDAFKAGMTKLREKVNAAGARLILMTPPVFDAQPIMARTSDEGGAKPFKGYDGVLGAYAKWQVEQRASGWDVGDLHTLMKQQLEARRKGDPAFTFARDGVHPGPAGHWVMAVALLRQLGVPADADVAQVEAGEPRASRGNVSAIRKNEAGELSFTWRLRRPMPRDPELEKDGFLMSSEIAPAKLNVRRFSVSGLKEARYALYEGETKLGEFGREELAKGIDVDRLEALSANAGGERLRKLIHDKLSTTGDAWRSHVGHKRPGVKAGLPPEQAAEKVATIDAEIAGLVKAAEVKVRLVAAK